MFVARLNGRLKCVELNEGERLRDLETGISDADAS